MLRTEQSWVRRNGVEGPGPSADDNHCRADVQYHSETWRGVMLSYSKFYLLVNSNKRQQIMICFFKSFIWLSQHK